MGHAPDDNVSHTHRNPQASKMVSTTLIFATLLLVTVASAADPTCSTGVVGLDACCPAACEKCGGADCGKRSRESGLKCCIGAIKKMDANCLTSDPPCKITTKDPDFMAGSDIPDPKCENGLRKNRACCPPECSVCGGKGCKQRGVLIKSECCPNMIKAGPRGCRDTGAPCALFKKSDVPPEPMMTPMMVEPTPMATPMEPEPMPVETPMMTEMPVPSVCKNMRKKFIGGCFCYLLLSNNITIKKAYLFRRFCRKKFGTKRKILSMAFTCRRFKTGVNAAERVEKILKKLNELIPICDVDLPMIEKKL